MPDALTPAEHTPGSWKVGSSLYDGFVACVFVDVGEQMKTLAEVRKYKDAVLFSAAPDLLAALHECVGTLDYILMTEDETPVPIAGFLDPAELADLRGRRDRARSAIAKAEGRSAASTARSQDGSRRDGDAGGRGT